MSFIRSKPDQESLDVIRKKALYVIIRLTVERTHERYQYFQYPITGLTGLEDFMRLCHLCILDLHFAACPTSLQYPGFRSAG
jgi:hypothetical protein